MNGLEKIGMTKNEIRVYKSLLKQGLVTSGSLIKDTGIHPSALYYALDNLSEKGLVSSVTKSNTKHFQANSPERLLTMLDKRRNELEESVEELKKIRKPVDEPVVARVHEGYAGFEGIYDRILRRLGEGDEYYVFGARQLGDPDNKAIADLLDRFNAKREKQKIHLKIIFNRDVKKRVRKIIKDFDMIEARFMETPTNSFVLIYDDRVVSFLYTERLIGVEIHSDEVYRSYREFFRLMWKSAER